MGSGRTDVLHQRPRGRGADNRCPLLHDYLGKIGTQSGYFHAEAVRQKFGETSFAGKVRRFFPSETILSEESILAAR